MVHRALPLCRSASIRNAKAWSIPLRYRPRRWGKPVNPGPKRQAVADSAASAASQDRGSMATAKKLDGHGRWPSSAERKRPERCVLRRAGRLGGQRATLSWWGGVRPMRPSNLARDCFAIVFQQGRAALAGDTPFSARRATTGTTRNDRHDAQRPARRATTGTTRNDRHDAQRPARPAQCAQVATVDAPGNRSTTLCNILGNVTQCIDALRWHLDLERGRLRSPQQGADGSVRPPLNQGIAGREGADQRRKEGNLAMGRGSRMLEADFVHVRTSPG